MKMAKKLYGMGLFGYNEKSFNKNTELFIEKLSSILEIFCNREFYNKEALDIGAGKAIDGLIHIIDGMRHDYNKQGKDYKTVDKMILELISKMEEDAKSNKFASLILRADNLSRELDQSRRYGKDAFIKEEREAMEIMAQAYQCIYDLTKEREDLEARKEAIVEKAVNASDPERQKLSLEFEHLNTETQGINRTISAWISRYDTAFRVLNARAIGGMHVSRSALDVSEISIKILQKELSQIVWRIEKKGYPDGEPDFMGFVSEEPRIKSDPSLFESLVNEKANQQKDEKPSEGDDPLMKDPLMK